MHIPDGFLTTPVWAALDAAAIPAVAYVARKSQSHSEDRHLPLMGVMGAFVFAAQIINFPVGVGTSGHLVGGALLAMTLGPWAATLVMTSILVIQALVFQDGGLLALGANVVNMALFGVWAGYLPSRIWTRRPGVAAFAGGFLSVLVSALLALSELRLSGVSVPSGLLAVSLGLFTISAALEGAITLAVFQALNRMGKRYVRAAEPAGSRVIASVALTAVILVTGGVLVASNAPDGIESLARQTGISNRVTNLFSTPLADYQFAFAANPWLARASAGLLGLLAVFVACLLVGRLLVRRREPVVAATSPAAVSGD